VDRSRFVATPGSSDPGEEQIDAGRLPLTMAAAALLGICGLVYAVGIVAELRYLAFVQAGTFGFYDPVTYSARVDQVNTLTTVARLMALPTGIVFILWFRRAYRNLPALGIFNLRWSPGWAVGAWFVPFLNLVRPVRIAADIWRCSEPTLPMQASRPRGRVPATLALWWAAWLGASVPIVVASLVSRHATSSADLETASLCRLVGDALQIAAAVFAILFVFDVANRQKLRAKVLAGEIRVRSAALDTHSLTSGTGSPGPRRDVESLATPGGTPCPSCGFENHRYAPSCLRCHARLEPSV